MIKETVLSFALGAVIILMALQYLFNRVMETLLWEVGSTVLLVSNGVGLVFVVGLTAKLAYVVAGWSEDWKQKRHQTRQAELTTKEHEIKLIEARAKAFEAEARARAAANFSTVIKQNEVLLTERNDLQLYVPPTRTQVKNNELALLEDHIEEPVVLPHESWFDTVIDAVHTIIIGGTGDGKTTTAQAICAARARHGEKFVFFDPHAKRTDWRGMPVFGAGRNYEQINMALPMLIAELDERYKAWTVNPEATFESITIVVDETTAIADHCDNWANFIKTVSLEGRKVGMRLLVLAHSRLVKMLGLEGRSDIRENFTEIFLGNHAVKRVAEAQELSRPAVLATIRQISIIDVRRIPRIATHVEKLPLYFKPEELERRLAKPAPEEDEQEQLDFQLFQDLKLVMENIKQVRFRKGRVVQASVGRILGIRGGRDYSRVQDVANYLNTTKNENGKLISTTKN